MEDLVAGRYRLVSRIGMGNQGEVWRADDRVAEAEVAVKLTWTAPRARGRALAEGVLLRTLPIRGVASVLDEGEHDGRHFLVTTLVDGVAFPGRASPLPWRELRDVALGLLDVLDAVHQAGVVHGDLKPENVLVDSHGAAWVLDFGAASAVTWGARRSGMAPNALGTPAYVAPERVSRSLVVPEGDLYSLGVMFFEALTGALPHRGDTPAAILEAKLARPAPPIASSVASVPTHVAALIDRLLATEVSERPRSAGEARDRLADAAPPTFSTHSMNRRREPDALRPLFTGDDRLLHLPSDAADALHRRTDGDPTRVEMELIRWCQLGIARRTGDRYAVDRASLDLLDAWDDPAPSAPAVDLMVAAAANAEREGHLGRALVLFEDASRISRADGETDAATLAGLFEGWIEVVAAQHSASDADRLAYELARHNTNFSSRRTVEELARSLVELASDPVRALARLDALETPDGSSALTRCREGLRMVAARSASVDEERRILTEVSARVEAASDRALAARLDGWRGRVAYREGRYTDAARDHLRSADGLERPLERLAARLNAAAALLEVYELDAIVEIVEAARRERVRAPLLEARAEWLLRSVYYRREDALAPDLELMRAAEQLGVPHIEAQIACTEAAFAWRRGELATSSRLAARAEHLWRTRRTFIDFAWMARALRLACGEPADDGVVRAIVKVASGCDIPGVGIQTLGLLARARGVRFEVEPKIVERLADTVDPAFVNRRVDVLSVEEARAAIELRGTGS